MVVNFFEVDVGGFRSFHVLVTTVTGHTRNLIARTLPFDIPLKKTLKIFADQSISLKFVRMVANEYRKIFTITKNSCFKHENSTKR